MTADGGPTTEQLARLAQINELLARFASDQQDHARRWQEMHSQIPLRLFHYTTIEGAMGIVGSAAFWASDVRYVNDSSELSYAESLISEVAKGVVSEEATDHTSDALAIFVARGGIVDPISLRGRPFIACFCESGDLLSQWRGYGSGDAPVALGLDMSVAGHLLPPGTYLRKVVYDEQEQRDEAASVTRTWLKTLGEVIREQAHPIEDLLPYPALWALQRALAEHSLCFKHPSFSEEQEWRLITLVDVDAELSAKELQGYSAAVPGVTARVTGVDIGFRPSSLGLVPYVSLDLRQQGGAFDGRLPLRNVIQGPTSNPELRLDALHKFFRSRGYGHVAIEFRASGIPLRR